jgi:serine/threonine protein kinase
VSRHERAITQAPDSDEVPGYEELTELHRTAFATTYRAQRDGEHVVLKVLRGEVADAPARKALARYRSAAGKLEGNPYVLHVVDGGSTYGGLPFVVTRYCKFGSLGDRLAASGPLSIVDALGAAVPVAVALHAAHLTGLCHRGVRPSNILLGQGNQPVLADFVTAGLRADRAVSAAGPTPAYTAPEVISGADASPRSDIYALAATVFHLLTGRQPYPDRGGVAGLLLSIMTDKPPVISRADAPDSLRAVIARALATDPDGRFPDALAFAAELHRVLVELGLPVPYSADIWPDRTAPGRPGAAPAPIEAPPVVGPAADPAPPAFPDLPLSRPDRPPPAEPPDEPAETTSSVLAVAEDPASTEPGAPQIAGAAAANADLARADTVELPAVAAALPPDLFAVPARRTRRRRGATSATVGAGVLVIGALAVAAVFAPGAGSRPPAPAPSSPTAAAPRATTTAAPRATTTAIGAPTAITAIDEGAIIRLQWALPAGSERANIVVQQAPASPGQAPLTVLNPGATSFQATGLDRAAGYCFRVGALISLARTGQPATVAWSQPPTCVRGAQAAMPS